MPGGHGGDVNRCRGDCADEQDETEAERGERDVRARGADRVSYDANGRGISSQPNTGLNARPISR
jgi:hypothetical protein